MLSSLSIRIKIALPAIIGVSALLLVCLIGYVGISSQGQVLHDMAETQFKRTQQINNIALDLHGARGGFYRLLAMIQANASTDSIKKYASEQLDQLDQSSQALADWSKAGISSAEEEQMISRLLSAIEAYRKETASALDMIDVDPNMTSMMIQSADTKFDNSSEVLHELVSLREQSASSAAKEAEESTSHILAFFLIASLAFTTGAITLAFLLARSVRVSIERLVHSIRHAESGDLTRNTPPLSNDDIGQAQGAFERLRQNMLDLIGQIQSRVDIVRETAGQIRGESSQQQDYITQQASAIDSTAVSVEEISTSMAQIANISQEAERAFSNTHQQTIEAMATASAMDQATEEIFSSIQNNAEMASNLKTYSKEIETIVHVIRDIADQTNLLALNAAIEAARAGEQGRGFAVVADEVRNLAGRTASATVEIARVISTVVNETDRAYQNISSSQDAIDKGRERAREISTMIGRIQGEANSSLSRIKELTHTLGEQDAALQLIAQSVESLTARMNASRELAITSAEHAQVLGNEMKPLTDAIGRFRTSHL